MFFYSYIQYYFLSLILQWIYVYVIKLINICFFMFCMRQPSPLHAINHHRQFVCVCGIHGCLSPSCGLHWYCWQDHHENKETVTFLWYRSLRCFLCLHRWCQMSGQQQKTGSFTSHVTGIWMEVSSRFQYSESSSWIRDQQKSQKFKGQSRSICVICIWCRDVCVWENNTVFSLRKDSVVCLHLNSSIKCLNVSVYNHIKHLKSGINDTAAVFLL